LSLTIFLAQVDLPEQSEQPKQIDNKSCLVIFRPIISTKLPHPLPHPHF
jgi:hypothetical protein